MQDDPTAFYSYEEYTAAADALYDLVQLRAQSIAGQLDGTIPSTEAGQQGSDALIDASSIDLSSLGSMMGGGGPGDFGDFGDFDPTAAGDGADPAQAAPTGGTAPTQEGTSAGTDTAEDGATTGRPAPGGAPPDRSDASSDGGDTADAAPQGPGRPGGSSDTDTSGTSRQNLILYAVSAAVLLVALAIVLRYRRRPD